MRLDWALLANGAEAPPNGLVYILGAGFDTLVRDKVPTPFNGVIGLHLPTTRLETQRPHQADGHSRGQDGQLASTHSIVRNLPPRQVTADFPHCMHTSATI